MTPKMRLAKSSVRNHVVVSVSATQSMKELIAYIAGSMVNQPEAVEVTEAVDGRNVTLRLKVAKEDIGKIIGRQGRTIRAMRVVLGAASAKADKRYVLELSE